MRPTCPCPSHPSSSTGCQPQPAWAAPSAPAPAVSAAVAYGRRAHPLAAIPILVVCPPTTPTWMLHVLHGDDVLLGSTATTTNRRTAAGSPLPPDPLIACTSGAGASSSRAFATSQVHCARAAGPAGWAAVPYDIRVEAAQRLASTGALRSLDAAVRLQLAHGEPLLAYQVGCCAVGTFCTILSSNRRTAPASNAGRSLSAQGQMCP